MRALVLALVLLVAAGLLLSARLAWPVGGSGGTMLPVHPPAATATPAPTPAASPDQDLPDAGGAEEPQPLTHRRSVLDRFVCANCHSPGGSWPVPNDHASLERECVACHAPAPEPAPISLHRDSGESLADPLCFSCHGDFASQAPVPRRAAEAEECSTCHDVPDKRVLPSGHEGRSSVSCMVCHETRSLVEPKIPHPVDDRQECSFCHGKGRLKLAEGAHEGRKNDECLRCHDTSLAPPHLPARMLQLSAEKEGCTGCHASGGLAPLPPSHEGRTEALCGVCHSAVQNKAPLVPHTPGQSAACTKCHTPERLAGLSVKHAGVSEKACATCHVSQPGAVPAIPHEVAGRGNCTDCHAPSPGPLAPTHPPP